MPRRPQRTAPYPVVDRGTACGLPLRQQTNEPSTQRTPQASVPLTQVELESWNGGATNRSAPPPISFSSCLPCSPSLPSLPSGSTGAAVSVPGADRLPQNDQQQEQVTWGPPRVNLVEAAQRAGLSRKVVEKHLAMRLGKSGHEQLLKAVNERHGVIAAIKAANRSKFFGGLYFPAQDHLAYLPIVDLWDVAEKMNVVDPFIVHFNITIYDAGKQTNESRGVRVGNAPHSTFPTASPSEFTGTVTSYTAGNGVSAASAPTTQTWSEPATFCPPNSWFPLQQPQIYPAQGQAQQTLSLPVMQQHSTYAFWPPHTELVGQQMMPQSGLPQLYAEQLDSTQPSSQQMQGYTATPAATQPTTAQQFEPQSQAALLQAQVPASQTTASGNITASEQSDQQTMASLPVQHQTHFYGLQMQPLQPDGMQQHQMQYHMHPQGLQMHIAQTDQLQQAEEQHLSQEPPGSSIPSLLHQEDDKEKGGPLFSAAAEHTEQPNNPSVPSQCLEQFFATDPDADSEAEDLVIVDKLMASFRAV